MAWKSYYMKLEDFTLENFNSLLRWIGEVCTATLASPVLGGVS